MGNKVLNAFLVLIVIAGMAGVYFYQQQNSDQLEVTDEMNDSATMQKYGVAAAHPEAVNAGMQILEQGGNAVDAAIAVSYALGVVEPFGSGIGGGGTMLVYPNNEKQKPVVFDYRETAPYSGIVPQNGVGVPGLVKGMELAHKKFGSLPMSKLIQPSIDLAENGFEVTHLLSGRIRDAQWRMDVERMPHFYPNGSPIQPKQLLQQKELANTLKSIQEKGSSAFYEGIIAQDIENVAGGVKASDLKKYEALEKEPVKVTYKGYEMYSPPPPAGGIMLAQSLMMANQEDIKSLPDLSADQIHLLGEINKRVQYSRSQHIGDPKFVNIRMDDLTSQDYVQKLASDINKNHLSDQYKEMADTLADQEDHDNTTHFVVVDKNGMMVSVTNTLSNFFGSGIYVDGFFLNNQLKNFSTLNSSPNRAQLGKRPVSYTAPTIFTKDGHPVLGIGSAGGRRITPMLTEVIVRALEYDMPLQAAIDQTRFLVEDNIIYVEKDLSAETKAKLKKKGYTVIIKPATLFYGGVQGIKVDRENNTIEGGFDNRRDGAFRSSD